MTPTPAEIERIEETGEDDESVEMTALVRSVAQQFSTLVAESSRLSDELQVLVANLGDPSKLSDLVASNLDLDVAGKQQILEANHIGIRLRLVLDQLSKETEALQIETEIKEKVQNEMGRTQRDYMLRQQLEAIRRELGESEEGEEGAEDLKAMAMLIGISLGAVFMGAMTYIGNGPNFMVRAIAEQSGVRMPSFFGYVIKYSVPVLIPIFLLATLIFLL